MGKIRVFKLWADVEGFRGCCVPQGTVLPEVFDGSSYKNKWQPFEIYFEPAKRGEIDTPPDIAFSGTPALSARAVMGLRSILEEYGELLPITCPNGTYMVFNVTTVIDVLDLANSQGDRFADGRFMTITEFVFKDTGFHGEEVFRIKGYERGSQFCTGAFVERVESLGLTGFDFDYVGNVKIPEDKLNLDT